MTARSDSRSGARLGALPAPNATVARAPWVPLAAGAALAFGLAWFLFRNSAQAPSDRGDEEDEQESAPPEPRGPHESYELEDEPEDVEVEPA